MLTPFCPRPDPVANWGPAYSNNLYPLWITSPAQAISRIAGHLAFRPAEIEAAALWSAKQKPLGLRADVHRDGDGNPVILEVYGPDDLVPHCILYAVATGIQADEFTGTSTVYPCVESALRELAPLC